MAQGTHWALAAKQAFFAIWTKGSTPVWSMFVTDVADLLIIHPPVSTRPQTPCNKTALCFHQNEKKGKGQLKKILRAYAIKFHFREKIFREKTSCPEAPARCLHKSYGACFAHVSRTWKKKCQHCLLAGSFCNLTGFAHRDTPTQGHREKRSSLVTIPRQYANAGLKLPS